jgi:hypothetical protein
MNSRRFFRRLWRYPILLSILIVVVSVPLDLYFLWFVIPGAPLTPNPTSGAVYAYISGAEVHYVTYAARLPDLVLQAAIWVVVPVLILGDFLWAIVYGEFGHWPHSKPHPPPQ